MTSAIFPQFSGCNNPTIRLNSTVCGPRGQTRRAARTPCNKWAGVFPPRGSRSPGALAGLRLPATQPQRPKNTPWLRLQPPPSPQPPPPSLVFPAPRLPFLLPVFISQGSPTGHRPGEHQTPTPYSPCAPLDSLRGHTVSPEQGTCSVLQTCWRRFYHLHSRNSEDASPRAVRSRWNFHEWP